MTLALLGACSRRGQIEDGGVYVTRSACPQVAIPGATGDITLFNPAGTTVASAIDVSAAITNLRANCTQDASFVNSTVSFDVVATRRDRAAARQVVLPFYDVAVQGGTNVVAKKVGAVAVDFPAGSARGQGRGQASVRISRAAATLPADVVRRLTAERKPGQESAAVDPLTNPQTRAAVARATFEHLIGFALTQDQLRYNATR
ncbi:hypothetical protein HMF7854_06435 [Sphingomonas ginkgonis]|uniref:Uncharacterized protein n=2 Tax=Sphingomonas ginkgonis TaxID=2315330 RepID=A0A429VDS7_9SPHN|nr:hypothetical protein HMF7854_06435 [Sphingomonas ginkgonis]